MDFSLSEEMYTRLAGLADRRGWSVEELTGAYLMAAADLDEAGRAGLVNEDEHALIVTGLIALGLPEGWEVIQKMDDEWTLLWVRRS